MTWQHELMLRITAYCSIMYERPEIERLKRRIVELEEELAVARHFRSVGNGADRVFYFRGAMI